MKKFLLSLLALVSMMSAGAATLVMKDILGTEDIKSFSSVTTGDFTISASKAGGTTEPAYYANGNDMRIYAKGTLTIAAKEPMTKMVFTISNKERYTTVTASTGTVATQSADDTVLTWTGDATSVTFTVGDKATLGTAGTDKSGQFRFTQVEITGGGEAGEVVTPEPTPVEGVADIAAWITKGDTDNAVAIDGALTAVYQNGSSLYVKDKSGWLLVYGSLDQTYKNGDVIPAGANGKFQDFHGLPEMTSPAGFTAATAGTPVEAEEIMAADLNTCALSSYVKLTDVTIEFDAADTTNRTFKANDGSEDFVIYNTFTKTVAVPTGEGYTVYGFVGVRDGVYQITPIEVLTASGELSVSAPVFTPGAGAVVAGTAVTIACTTADAAIYYTLDGTEPTTASTLYSEPIVINEATTVKAVAVKEGMNNSAVVTAAYTIQEVIEPSGDSAIFIAPTFTEAEGVKLMNKDNTDTQGSNKEESQSLVGEKFNGNNVTLEFVHGDGDYFSGAYGAQVRWYQGEKIVLTPASGKKVVKVFVQTVTSSKGNFTVTNTAGEVVGTVVGEGTGATTPITWTGDAEGALTLTSNKAIRFSYIEVFTAQGAGVEAIESEDANAPVEYYNLQGVRVAEPANGLYIRRQGNTVTKVLVK